MSSVQTRSSIVFAFILILSGCSASSDQAAYAELEKVSLMTTNQEISALIWIAEANGYFAENGLDVEIVEASSGVEGVNKIIAHTIDVAAAAEFVIAKMSFEHPDMRIFGTLARSKNVHVVARADSGIQTPSDLKGKKIGFTKGSNAEFFTASFLTFNRLAPSDVEFVYLSPSKALESLLAGDVDAITIWEPHVFEAQSAMGENALVWDAQHGQDAYWVLVANHDFVSENPGIIHKMTKGMLQSLEFIEQNDEAAKKIIAGRLQLSKPYLDSVWNKSRFTFSLEQPLILAMETEARWLLASNITSAPAIPNFLDYVYVDAMEELKPDAVAIIR